MRRGFRQRIGWVLALAIVPASTSIRAVAAHFPMHVHGGHAMMSHHHHDDDGGAGGLAVGFGVGGGWGWYGYPVLGVPFPVIMPYFVPVAVTRGPLIVGPMPPPIKQMPPPIPAVRARRADPAKSTNLVTIGDRLFRAGNFKRATERYEQAVRADPDAAAPRVHLAQVALVRGQFKEAADHLRAAITVDPNYLTRASDIQAVYAEPGDFRKQISKLESHVLLDPTDRDAWLVLGAELYLSGKTRRASDVFLRLSDRKPDPTLAAFLDASNPPAK